MTTPSPQWNNPYAVSMYNEGPLGQLVAKTFTSLRSWFQPRAWTAITLAAGATALGSPFRAPSYLVDPHGFVHISGPVNIPSIAIGGSFTIGTIPAALAPTLRELFPAVLGGQVAFRVDVDASGNLIAVNNFGTASSATFLSLSGITFKAAG